MAHEQTWTAADAGTGAMSGGERLEIDLSVIDDLAGGDRAERAELIAQFIRHTEQGIGKVRTALAADDLGQAARAAHTCVGFSAMLGMRPVVVPLRRLERALRAANLRLAALCLQRWEHRFRQMRAHLIASSEQAGTS